MSVECAVGVAFRIGKTNSFVKMKDLCRTSERGYGRSRNESGLSEIVFYRGHAGFFNQFTCAMLGSENLTG